MPVQVYTYKFFDIGLLLFDCLSNNKIVDLSELKVIPDNKNKYDKELKFGSGHLKKILIEKEKMVLTSIFSFSHNVFKKPLS